MKWRDGCVQIVVGVNSKKTNQSQSTLCPTGGKNSNQNLSFLRKTTTLLRNFCTFFGFRDFYHRVLPGNLFYNCFFLGKSDCLVLSTLLYSSLTQKKTFLKINSLFLLKPSVHNRCLVISCFIP